MGNCFPTNGARAETTDKAVKSPTIDGGDVEKSSGQGGVKKKEAEASSLDTGAAATTSRGTSRNERKIMKNKEEKNGLELKSSSKVILDNQTDKVLVLREKVRAANGIIRYQIEARKSLPIHIVPHSTYARFLVYAVEVQDSKTEDTGLTIDTDKLGDASRIVFSKDNDGNYKIC